jgi:DNA-binding protein H-NS
MSTDNINSSYPPEKIAAIRKIRKLMEFWRITPGEIRAAPRVVVVQAEVSAPPRYRHPVSGETWDGQGRQPDWLRHALTQQGYTVDELRRAVLDAVQPSVASTENAELPIESEDGSNSGVN